jgi:hypothetical protein
MSHVGAFFGDFDSRCLHAPALDARAFDMDARYQGFGYVPHLFETCDTQCLAQLDEGTENLIARGSGRKIEV